ncbi:protein-disulfide reductase DsbD [Kushneria aurantia]|uniref:Thiol:disulfide interchange protein DsbD n=1 Tax=Kushneria aurantia TaxID=504092 RepID=A0ABV6G7L7_9GAMM|nr:protein-disulfide reductase DsbD [Kushneria aurantia]
MRRARHSWRLFTGILTLLLTLMALWPVTSLAQSSFFDDQPQILPADQAFQPRPEVVGDSLVIDWRIAPGYYLYRHAFALDAEGRALSLELPDGEPIEDEYFGRSEVYRLGLSMSAPLNGATQVTLHWQGCADAGLCYPPQQRSFDVDNLTASSSPFDDSTAPAASPLASPASDATNAFDASAPTEATAPQGAAASPDIAEDQRLAARLAGSAWLWTLAAFFGMGLLLTFTPCVLPMVPILSSLIVGQRREGEQRRTAGLVLSLAFVLPMAVTYALLGLIAALAGANLTLLLQNAWFIGAFAALFVLLSLAMFGLFELQLPSALRQRLDAGLSRQRGGRLKGAAAMGVLSALLVGPCMTAPLAGALLFIADSGNPWLGGAALLMLGLGMGAPLVLIATLGNHLLPRPGAWMVRVRVLFGFVLLGMAVWFVARVVPASVALALWGALGLALATTLWPRQRRGSASRHIAMALAAIIGVWSLLMLAGGAGGSRDPLQPLAVFTAAPLGTTTARFGDDAPVAFDRVESLGALQSRIVDAAQKGQITLVEFTADWCIACRVIENEVFSAPDVKRALADVQRLSVDLTDYSTADRNIMQHFNVIGPPTLLWFGADGVERRDQRVIGELSAKAFLEHLEKVRYTIGG